MAEPITIAMFDAKPYDRQFFNALNKKFNYQISYFENRLTTETVALAKAHDVVCAFVHDTISAEVITALKDFGVRLIALRSAGYNNVDLKAAYKTLAVVRVPQYSPHAVAEHTVALILALNRKTHKSYYRTRDGNFAITGLMGFDMAGKTAGVIGTGRIGKIVAAILRGFEMQVLAYDLYPDQAAAERIGFQYVDLESLYRDSDIVTLHCPLSQSTYHIVSQESIAKMKDSVMIINTGRGGLIDTKALIKALKSGKVGAAGLDVYEEESEYFYEDFSTQVLTDDILARLLTFSNVLITSHQGFFTKEALENIALTTLVNIRDFFADQPLENEICYRCGQGECAKKTQGRCF